MSPLCSIIQRFKYTLYDQYGDTLLPSHRKALEAMGDCRQPGNRLMKAQCYTCHYQLHIPHSCGHRSCPHCQHHDSEQWLERQLNRRVPANYFLVTFTLPAQLRHVAWHHQRIVYDALIQSAWETLKTFSLNDRQLNGMPGAIAVLHTHARDLAYHPHVHVVIPAAAVDNARRLWRTKTFKRKARYLFNHNALAKVFRAKMLDTLSPHDLHLPAKTPSTWVVDCKAVGTGEKALVYLGRYLYRGVLPEKNIVSFDDNTVTYRYQDSNTKKWIYKTLPGAEFLWRLLKHVLPKRFRRTRNYGFLHPNSKRMINLIQQRFKLDANMPILKKERPKLTCPCCGEKMTFIAFRIHPADYRTQTTLLERRTLSVM